MWTDVGRGVAAGAGVATLCTVLLALALERGARDLPAAPSSFLAWYWAAGLVGGAVWGVLRRRRNSLVGYLVSGAAVGPVVLVPLGVLIPLGEHASVDAMFLFLTALVGIPVGTIIGLMLWLRRSPT